VSCGLGGLAFGPALTGRNTAPKWREQMKTLKAIELTLLHIAGVCAIGFAWLIALGVVRF